jgi:hypothetical protein
VGRSRLGPVRNGHPRDASRIEQDHPVVLVRGLDHAEPRPNPLLRAHVGGRREPPPHQAGEGGVSAEYGGITEPLSSPPRQIVDLQLGDGGKLMLYRGAETALVAPVGEVPGRRDARRQESKERDQYESSAT